MAGLALAVGVLAGARAEADDQEPVPGVPGAPAAGAPAPAGDPGDPRVREPGDDARPEKPWSRGVPMETRERARALFLEGNSYANIPLFAPAAEKFQEALALWPHPAIHFNLALAQLNLVQPVESFQSFSRALEHGPGPLGDAYYQRGREYLERLERQLGRIEIACEQPGAAVTMDGRPLFTGPGRWQGVVVPGEHQVLASADGFIPATERVVVSAGERATVTLSLQRPAYLGTERRWPAWRPWAVASAGALVVAAGAMIDWRAFASFERYDDGVAEMCGDTRGCPAATFSASLRTTRQHAARLERVAHATYAVGAAALAASAVLVYLNRERPVRRPGADANSAALLPVLTPDLASVVVRWRF